MTLVSSGTVSSHASRPNTAHKTFAPNERMKTIYAMRHDLGTRTVKFGGRAVRGPPSAPT